MKKLFQYSILVLVVCLNFVMSGCNRKPAYSDIKVEQPARANSESAQTANKSADPVAEVDQKAQAAESQPSAQPTEQKKFEIPASLDTTKGEIKDIPKYPGSGVTNIQYGPLGDASVVFMVLQAKGPIEKIGEYYDKEIKRNGWTVVSNTRDPILYEWTLKKGEANEATVKITKDENSGAIYIALTRTEKKVEPKQQ